MNESAGWILSAIVALAIIIEYIYSWRKETRVHRDKQKELKRSQPKSKKY